MLRERCREGGALKPLGRVLDEPGDVVVDARLLPDNERPNSILRLEHLFCLVVVRIDCVNISRV